MPRVRQGNFRTELFERYQRSEQALLLAMMEMVVSGVSTRKVKRITEELCGTSFSKSTVSELCKQLDPVVQAWNERPLRAKGYPFLLVDALVLKAREQGMVRPRSMMVAVGVNEEGYREILGVRVGDSESEASWTEFLRWLKERGLCGVDVVVSDDHPGLVKAIQKCFQGAMWQRCQTHFARNVLDVCPKALQPKLAARLKSLFDAPDMATARKLLEGIVDEFGARAPKAVECLEDGFEDAMAVLALPKPYRRRLRTTNMLERLIEEVRRRERVIRIFPTVALAERLLGAVLMEIDEEWTIGRKYLDMTAYFEWKAEQERLTAQEAEKQGNPVA